MSLADLMKKGSLRQLATVTVATVATSRAESLPSVASVATVSVATVQKQAANDPAQVLAPSSPCKAASQVAIQTPVLQDLDRWCWPHCQAMTGREIDTFTARLALFTEKGLMLDDAEALADRLVIRDREKGGRRMCLECLHLAGHGAASWRCENWQAAGVAIRARDARVAGDLVCQLQRCEGFSDQYARAGSQPLNSQTHQSLTEM